MIGMDAHSGRAIGTLAHIRQSITDILGTPIGTRVMRREYGSMLPYLIDAPMDRVTVLDIIQQSAGAIARWEPRVRVERVEVEEAAEGRITLALDLLVLNTGESARLEGVAI